MSTEYNDNTSTEHISISGPMDYPLHAWLCKQTPLGPTSVAHALVESKDIREAKQRLGRLAATDVRGSLDVTVRFHISDLAKVIEKYPKEWLSLTAEELKSRGSFKEWERACVFIDEYLDAQVMIWDGYGDNFTTIHVDWDDTRFPWDEERANALMDLLPKHLRFTDGEPPKDPGPQPMDGDQPLFSLDHE